MTIYVDDLREVRSPKGTRVSSFATLFSDYVPGSNPQAGIQDELATFVRNVFSMPPEAVRMDRLVPHVLLTPAQREVALQRGALHSRGALAELLQRRWSEKRGGGATLKVVGTDYLELIEGMGAPIVLLADLKAATGKVMAIRHDVDHDLQLALKFARMESSWGIRSTYFLLHTAKYWPDTKALLASAKEMVALGHEVGLHLDGISEFVSGRKDPVTVLRAALVTLRQAVPVRAAAAHGSPYCYTHGFRNYEVFREFDITQNDSGGRMSGRFPRVSMADLGIECEAYLSTDHNHYLSDSGGSWRGWIGNPRPRPFERLDPPIDKKFGVAAAFAAAPQGKLQMLTHPIWWEVRS